jgi:hypothetical protein
MDEAAAVAIVAIIGLTMLGVSYFIFIRQDGTVLFALSSIIGGIAGYKYGKRAVVKAK